MYQKQRSEITWLKERDFNTKFFHSIASGRHNKNFIPRISQNDLWIKGNQNLGKIFSNQLGLLYGTSRFTRFLLDWQHLFSYKERIDLTNLDQSFSLEEIKQAMFDLGADKAPCRDGFPIFFFQTNWGLIKDSLISFCEYFFEGSANLDRLNWIHIALIAKSNSPEKTSDFRPISLINSSCKIISKVLANRLGQVIGSLIDDSELVFINGRCIDDNIIAAQEMIFHLQNKSLQAMPAKSILQKSKIQRSYSCKVN